jgi:long-chain acyl-CoA synthetase
MERPWLQLYGADMPHSTAPAHADMLSLFEQAVARGAGRPFLYYFDTAITYAEADALSGALAAELHTRGIDPGERVAIYVQNMPQFILSVIAAWKLGAIAVSVNPMLKSEELAKILDDSGARVLIALDTIYAENGAAVIGPSPVEHVITTSALEFLDPDNPPAMLRGIEPVETPGCTDWMALIREHEGERPERPVLGAEDVAFLVYTSGTTGPAKGAMNTHGNVASLCEMARVWNRLSPHDVILTIAPLFHITGLILGFAFALTLANPVVLYYRFDPVVTAALIQRHQVTYTVAAITAFIAILNHADIDPSALASLKTVGAGGAPNPPPVIDAFEKRFGVYLHGGYGLTESTAPTHGVPRGARAPVDPGSGALSIGVPLPNVEARIIDDDGNTLPPGEIGEIAVRSPGVVAGYWNKPEETANAIRDRELRTGDVGFMNADGWFFIVDRKKDLIIASGYKVWPRDVEDVLYSHPAVREAAVIGVPDDYRGETVKAFVSLKPGETAAANALIAHCADHLAAYKRPAELVILDEMPKNASGKILRRELRA